MKINFRATTNALIVLGLCVCPATADVIKTFTLTVDGCTGGCGTGPFGTITLDQVNSTTVLVTETLFAGENFAGTGAGDSLEFNLSGVTGTTTLTNIPSDFHQDTGSPSASTFGSFGFGVDCNDVKNVCHGGQGTLTSLSFDVTNGNGINISNFVANSNGYFFASDIFSNNNTGNVGATGGGGGGGGGGQTPEPASFGLFGTGLGGLVLAYRRSRKRT